MHEDNDMTNNSMNRPDPYADDPAYPKRGSFEEWAARYYPDGTAPRPSQEQPDDTRSGGAA